MDGLKNLRSEDAMVKLRELAESIDICMLLGYRRKQNDQFSKNDGFRR